MFIRHVLLNALCFSLVTGRGIYAKENLSASALSVELHAFGGWVLGCLIIGL